jgi:hypothetical protein
MEAMAEQLELDIDRAPLKHLDYLARRVWSAHAAGTLDDDTAQGLAELIRDRQRAGGSPPAPPTKPGGGRPSVSRASRVPWSPDRQRSWDRRRRQSIHIGKLMPYGLAAKFTDGERAVLTVIATEIKLRGQCNLYVDQIGAFAGVSRSTVKSATRRARGLRLINVEEWRQAPDWNGPNRIRIVSPEWLTWLALGKTKMTVKPTPTTQDQYINQRKVFAVDSQKEAFQGAHGARFSTQSGP